MFFFFLIRLKSIEMNMDGLRDLMEGFSARTNEELAYAYRILSINYCPLFCHRLAGGRAIFNRQTHPIPHEKMTPELTI